MQSIVVGVTSHRNLAAAEIDGIRRRVRDFLARLRRDFPGLPLTVASALAAGGDQIVAEEALALGAQLIAPLPLPRDVYEGDFVDASERERFHALCARASVLEPPVADDGTLDGSSNGPQSREWHYAQTGIYLASHCHILLALWDGKPSMLPGGTAQVVDYYLTGRKPALVERRRGTCGQACIDDNDQRLAYHVVCSRDDADGAPAEGLLPLQTAWRTGAGMQPGAGPMPAAFRAMFARIVELNADCARHAPRIEAAARTVSRRPDPAAAPHAPIERSFAAADWLALHYQRRVLVAMRTMYTLAALMGIAFVLYDGLSQDYMIFVFLTLFASGVTLDVVSRGGATGTASTSTTARWPKDCVCRPTGAERGCR